MGTSQNCVQKLSEKGVERRSEHGFVRYIGAKTGRTVHCRCSVRLRFGCLQDFSDSFHQKLALAVVREDFSPVPMTREQGPPQPLETRTGVVRFCQVRSPRAVQDEISTGRCET
jgi:hypothetical protein